MGTHTSFGIVLERQHDFGSAIPSRGNVFRHVASVLFGINGETTRKTEVANLELAVGIDQQITGLEITVENVRRVDVLETAENLVDEGLEVSVCKWLAGPDDGSKIALHQLCIMNPRLVHGPSSRAV